MQTDQSFSKNDGQIEKSEIFEAKWKVPLPSMALNALYMYPLVLINNMCFIYLKSKNIALYISRTTKRFINTYYFYERMATLIAFLLKIYTLRSTF